MQFVWLKGHLTRRNEVRAGLFISINKITRSGNWTKGSFTEKSVKTTGLKSHIGLNSQQININEEKININCKKIIVNCEKIIGKNTSRKGIYRRRAGIVKEIKARTHKDKLKVVRIKSTKPIANKLEGQGNFPVKDSTWQYWVKLERNARGLVKWGKNSARLSFSSENLNRGKVKTNHRDKLQSGNIQVSCRVTLGQNIWTLPGKQ